MLLLDTTVLVYAVGGQHELRVPAQRLLRAVAEGLVRATTTPEVIQEFAHVRSRRVSRSQAANQAYDFTTLLSPLIATAEDDIARGLELWERRPALGSFDALLIAVGERVGATGVVSTDKAFSRQSLVPHLTIEQAADHSLS